MGAPVDRVHQQQQSSGTAEEHDGRRTAEQYAHRRLLGWHARAVQLRLPASVLRGAVRRASADAYAIPGMCPNGVTVAVRLKLVSRSARS